MWQGSGLSSKVNGSLQYIRLPPACYAMETYNINHKSGWFLEEV